MPRRMTAFLAGLLHLLWSHFAVAAEPTLEDVDRALASAEPVVLIGVPAEFLHPDAIADDDEIEAQSDWDYYLGEWLKNSAKPKKLKVIIVPLAVLTRALRTPVLKRKGCVTLFVKNRTLGLLYDGDDACILRWDEYDVGARWLEGTASASAVAEIGYKLTVVARARK